LKQSLPTLPVGHTKLRVPILGFGSAPIGNLYEAISDEQAVTTLRFAVETGVNFIDTAPKYGNGLSEHRVGLALQGIPRDRFILASKVGRLVTYDGSECPAYSKDDVLRSLEHSLERLKVDALEIVHIHDAETHYREALEQTFPILAELRSQGVIKAVGAGMNQWQMLEDFAMNADFDCFMLAGRYTLLEQGALGFLDLCQQKKIAVFLGGVFNSGILATGNKANAKYQYAAPPPTILEHVSKLETICQHYGASLKTVALQFALAHPAIASLVVGAVSPREIEENLEALFTSIPKELWETLKQEQLLPNHVPTPLERNP
jgi:D-threo-aldose 1-dehydrogenase